MADHQKHGATGVWAAGILAALILIPALYVLSAGPLVFVTAKWTADGSLFNWFYTPVVIVREYLPERAMDRFIDYIEWWAASAESTEP